MFNEFVFELSYLFVDGLNLKKLLYLKNIIWIGDKKFFGMYSFIDVMECFIDVYKFEFDVIVVILYCD